ncbi:MAG: exopeptidase family [Herbinix sp.]|jgi:D-alanyl-D-alanine dipeptidase|nr:exopeptidase family [Herbinix sp.]
MYYSQPIPKLVFPNVKEANTLESNEPLVDFYQMSKGNDRIYHAKPMYYQMGVHGACSKCYLRKTAAEKLFLAASLLPDGFKLKIYDAWRPALVQQTLYDQYYSIQKRLPQNAHKTEEELRNITTKFISYPSKNPLFPFVHSTGGAVDLTIVNELGEELDMGTGFDDFSDKANTSHYEDSVLATELTMEKNTSHLIRNHRRLLYHIMSEAGFTNLPSEWWHYDYGDLFWGYYKEKPSIYQGIFEITQVN